MLFGLARGPQALSLAAPFMLTLFNLHVLGKAAQFSIREGPFGNDYPLQIWQGLEGGQAADAFATLHLYIGEPGAPRQSFKIGYLAVVDSDRDQIGQFGQTG